MDLNRTKENVYRKISVLFNFITFVSDFCFVYFFAENIFQCVFYHYFIFILCDKCVKLIFVLFYLFEIYNDNNCVTLKIGLSSYVVVWIYSIIIIIAF